MEYQDGHKASMTANFIAQNLFAQVDEKGHRHVLFDEIVDNSTDGKELKQQGVLVATKSGTQRRRETTQGQEILVHWKDVSTLWVAFKYMKEAYPLHTAKYEVQSRLAQDSAFAWWFLIVLKK